MTQNVVFFTEHGNKREIFSQPLSDIIQMLYVDDLTQDDSKALSCIGNRLIININDHPIDLPRLTDLLNKGDNTFQLIPEKIESTDLFPTSELNDIIYALIPASRRDIDEKYDGEDDFEFDNPITCANYQIKDDFRYLQLKSVIVRGDNTQFVLCYQIQKQS